MFVCLHYILQLCFFYSRVKIFALPSQQQNLKSFVSLLMLFIVRGIHCLTIIDNPYFITFLCYSDPRIISSGHSSTITHKHMPEIYNEAVKRLIEELPLIRWVVVTADGSTCHNNHHYISVTTHYINSDMEMIFRV